LGNQAIFLSMEVQTPEKMSEEFDLNEEKKAEGEQTPELREVSRQALESFWKNWLDENIPALGGLTPRQAVKEDDGREKVIALLLEFERLDEDVVKREIQIKHIQNVRKQLGLTSEAPGKLIS